MKTIKITEGSAKLFVPETSFKDPFHQLVFFNPKMEFNRSVSALAVKAARKLVDGGVLLDGLCSTGPRGIRYLKESGIDRVVFVEANPDAVKLLRKNLAENKIPKKKFKIIEKDLNAALVESEERFDFVEIDPFGSPVFFLENAMRRLKKKAVMSVTSTDLSCLCGAEPKPCIRKYDSKPLKTEYCHELALRILIGRIARTAAMLDFSATPLFSFYQGHAAKTIMLLEKNAEKSNETADCIGFVNHCFNCLNRNAGDYREKCGVCGKAFSHAGPLWIGNTSDAAFVKSLEHSPGTGQFLGIVLGESGMPPGFFESSKVSQVTGKPSPQIDAILNGLKKKGFRATRTHYSPNGFKTDAPVKIVKGLFKR